MLCCVQLNVQPLAEAVCATVRTVVVREIVTMRKQDPIHAFKLFWCLFHACETHILLSYSSEESVYRIGQNFYEFVLLSDLKKLRLGGQHIQFRIAS